ncbi:MAG: tRNA (adenosine(37)-N6)-threonylcarbamoyltransferase complex ATPase subunit type 1 TsaE [Candidatus Pacebacteria bacterium]|nr:tRNA (adenosine(37)-N6)-threonylcarbamoyltransferase complex ATPase subunit type 1 TsaE [Candidatus Paceibacterota bacterium]
MKKEFLSRSAKSTKTFAKKVARLVLKRKKGPVILALFGELGGGKTTFLQGFAEELGVKKRIQSPTFILMRKFKVPKKTFKNFYHIDCYRIEKQEDISNLGIERIFKKEENIVAIEWADRVKKLLPKDIIQIEFKVKGQNTRKIILKKDGR